MNTEKAKGISRRDFIKGAASGAVGIAAFGLLGGCSTQANETEADNSNTQSLSTAESTTQGLSTNEELTSEQGLTTEQDIKADQELTTDILIFGAGAAGMMAALTAVSSGLDVILMEKGSSLAVSNGCMAGGPALAETQTQVAEDATVTADQLYNYMYDFTHCTVNAGLLRKSIERGSRVEEYFLDNGVPMGLRKDSYNVGFRARHNFNDAEGVQVKGSDRFEPLANAFTSAGGTLMLSMAGTSLIKEGNAVVGAYAQNQDDKTITRIDAKAVLIATGGYLGSTEMLQDHFGVTVNALGNTFSDGGGINMVLDAGGVLDRNWALCCNEFGGTNLKSGDIGIALRSSSSNLTYAIYGGLLVNQKGQRFMNEQYLSDEPLALGGEAAVREKKYYAILDDEYFQTVKSDGAYAYYGSPEEWYVGSVVIGDKVLDTNEEDLENDIEKGWALKTDDLSEAAEYFGLTDLVETVSTYNALCESGADTQFLKSSYLMKALKTPPYYVFEYESSAWCTFGGVKVDDNCRALSAEQETITGLYVAGVDTGSLYPSPYYSNEGAALGLAYTSGILAADNMVEYIESL